MGTVLCRCLTDTGLPDIAPFTDCHRAGDDFGKDRRNQPVNGPKLGPLDKTQYHAIMSH